MHTHNVQSVFVCRSWTLTSDMNIMRHNLLILNLLITIALLNMKNILVSLFNLFNPLMGTLQPQSSSDWYTGR